MNQQRNRIAMLLMATLLAGLSTASAQDKAPLPEPAIVTPPTTTAPPSDAVVLFDGKDMSGWVSAKDGQAPKGWKVEDGAMVGGGGGGDIVTKHQFDSAQLHLEFRLPESGKGHGNSGLYFHHLYELQIIDSYNPNKYQPGQQCAALYKKFPPMVNVCSRPGLWQSYDIIFHGAKVAPGNGGKVIEPARFTVFHNGVLVQHNRPMFKGTGGGAKNPMVAKGPLKIQDHGSPVAFRNIWIRPIKRHDSLAAAIATGVGKSQAPKVDPRGASIPVGKITAAPPPSDATVLFDGQGVNLFQGKKTDDGTFTWKVTGGYMEVTRGGGSISSTEKFGDVQLHVEWATPTEVKGKGQGRGNSGVYVHGTEVQVLDSYDNKTYPDGQASAIYKQYPPQVNASRPPGVWQSYDIIFRTAREAGPDGAAMPSTFTVLHNGVLTQDYVINKRSRKGTLGNLLLQDHGNPVRYRNIWIRKLN